MHIGYMPHIGPIVRGGFQIFYSVHALGIIHQQQSWFGAIC